jgi:hypothetical protein
MTVWEGEELDEISWDFMNYRATERVLCVCIVCLWSSERGPS